MYSLFFITSIITVLYGFGIFTNHRNSKNFRKYQFYLCALTFLLSIAAGAKLWISVLWGILAIYDFTRMRKEQNSLKEKDIKDKFFK